MTASRRGATGLSGVLVVDKPAGMTSHDVVAAVRRSTGERRIGHAGTLDPAATGVLVVLIGPATRLAPYLTAAEKSYLARIAFGTQTATDDAEGEPVRLAPVPDRLGEDAYAESVLEGLIGSHEQLPPVYSAIKRDGVTAYRAARAGAPLTLDPRSIEVIDARLVGIGREPDICWDASFTVSKGTYLRSIARDLGHSLETVAHLGALRRTASGSLTLADAHPLDRVIAEGADLADLFIDPVHALDLPVRIVSAEEATRVSHGVSLPLAAEAAGSIHPGAPVSVADSQHLHAIYALSADGGVLHPMSVIAGGVPR